MPTEYEWTINAGRLLSESVPAESLPQRAAITGIGVVIAGRGPRMKLLLCNPHASSWNNWLLPYGSITEPFALDTSKESKTFKDLSENLIAILKEHRHEYNQSIFKAIGEMLGWDGLQFDREVFFSSYSLKYSKTANVWTAYLFNYHKCHARSDKKPGVPTTWLPLNRTAIAAISKSAHYDGLPVAPNVITLVTDVVTTGGIAS
jgi:hypothetical protein